MQNRRNRIGKQECCVNGSTGAVVSPCGPPSDSHCKIG